MMLMTTIALYTAGDEITIRDTWMRIENQAQEITMMLTTTSLIIMAITMTMMTIALYS